MPLDEISRDKLSHVCPDLAVRWKNLSYDLQQMTGLRMRVSDGLRTFSQQRDDWAKGRRREGNSWVICDIKKVITHAQPGESFHQYGLALDSCFWGTDPYLEKMSVESADKIWLQYGDLCKKYGLEWGGNWTHPDRPHCELNYGMSLDTLRMIYQDRGIGGIWEKCKNVSQCGTLGE